MSSFQQQSPARERGRDRYEDCTLKTLFSNGASYDERARSGREQARYGQERLERSGYGQEQPSSQDSRQWQRR